MLSSRVFFIKPFSRLLCLNIRMEDDIGLIERYTAGDDSAVEELVMKYQRPLYAFICRMTNDMEEAKDITQKTFMNAVSGMKNFRRRASFRTWLYQIALNACLNHIRQRRPEEIEVEESIAGNQLGALSLLMEKQRHDAIRDAADRLPVRQRAAVILRAYEGLSCEETAVVMGCSEGAVKAQVMFDWCDQHMAALGAHWTRYSLLAAWPLIEPTLGNGYNWSANGPNGSPDAILGAVYAPGNDIHAVVNIQSLSFGTGTPTRSPFTNPTEYRDFVRALAERYDGDGFFDAPGSIKVDYFQLANEVQDWFDRYADEADRGADKYGQAAQVTLEALRSANPDAQLIMMGGFSRDGADVTLEDSYKQAILAMQKYGVKPAAIDIHWWFTSTNGVTWQSPVMLDARAFLDSIGWQDVQIWSMEDGVWTGCPARQTSMTEEEQAMTGRQYLHTSTRGGAILPCSTSSGARGAPAMSH